MNAFVRNHMSLVRQVHQHSAWTLSLVRPSELQVRRLTSSWVSVKVSSKVDENFRRKVFHRSTYLDQVHVDAMSNAEHVADLSQLEQLSSQQQGSGISISSRLGLLETLIGLPNDDNRKRMNLALIDKLECRRIAQAKLTLKQMLYKADLFYVSGCDPIKFIPAMIQFLDLNFDYYCFEPEDIVQLLFYIATSGKAPVVLMRKIEDFISANLMLFTGNELALICFAFFRTNTSFYNYALVRRIADRTLTDLVTPEFDINLVTNVVKVLRHARFENANYFEKLGDVLADLLPEKRDVKLNTLMHFAHTFASCGITHEAFFKTLGHCVHRLLNHGSQRSNVRIKELIKIVWAYMTLQHECPSDLIDILEKKLKHETGLLSTRFPEAFVEGLTALSMAGHYPIDCVDLVLSPSFLRRKSSRELEQDFQILLIDQAVAVECPKYKGNRISEDAQRKLTVSFRRSLNHELAARQGLASLLTTLNSMATSPSVIKCHFVLKHSMIADIELRVDGEGRVLPQDEVPDAVSDLPEVTSESPRPGSVTFEILNGASLHTLRRGDPANMHLLSQEATSTHRRLLIKVLGWNQYALNSPTVLGIHAMELRLLQKLGYEVLTINPKDAALLDTMDEQGRMRYVTENIVRKFNIDSI